MLSLEGRNRVSPALVLSSGSEEITALGSTYNVKTYGAEVGGAYSVMEEDFWGDTTPLRRHPDAEGGLRGAGWPA